MKLEAIQKYGIIPFEAIKEMREIPVKGGIEEIKRIFYETIIIQNERILDILDTISIRILGEK